MSAFRLRPARSTDAGKVGGILSEFVAQTDWMPKLHTGAEDIHFAGHMIDRGWVTVALAEDKICGFSARNGAEVNCLYIAAAQRGQGCGTALLDQMKQASAELELWTFEANVDAQKFYLKHGFTEVERTDGAATDEKLPDIRYRWRATGDAS